VTSPDRHSRALAWAAAVFLFLVADATAWAQTTSEPFDAGGSSPADVTAPPPAPAAAPEPAAAALPVIIRDNAGNATVRATRISQPIRIDGRLDEEVYATVTPIDGFIQQEPRPGGPATEKTEVWVLFDDQNLYFTCRCWEAHPELIVANEMRRDIVATGGQDHFAVGLDTFRDRRNAVFFLVTPVGGTFDALTTDEVGLNKDWNAVWNWRAGKFDGGWVTEMVIPFRSLRYRAGRDQTWGVQFRRTIRHKGEYTYLTATPQAFGNNALIRSSSFPALEGLQTPPPGHNIEVKPYAISDLRTDRLARPAFSNDPGADVGVDAKYGVTKGLTLDLTYNTDFAQVEEDEAQVNLSRFGLFFPEKREFFLENQGIFAFGGATNTGRQSASLTPSMFFSRRIGLAGGREVPIVGGARLSGRAGRYTVGLLDIRSDDAPSFGALATNFSVVRVKRDILRRSNIGALVTHRSNAIAGNGANAVYGIDGQYARQFLSINAYLAKSQTPGLNGRDLSYRTQLDYNADRYGLELERLVVDDNFNPEVGFMRREDFRRNFAKVRFSPRPKQVRLIRKYTYEGSFEYDTDNQNKLESRYFRGLFKLELQSGDSISVEQQRTLERIDIPFPISESDRLSVPVGTYEFDNTVAQYTLGAQHRLAGTATYEAGSFYGGHKQTAGLTGRLEVTVPFAIEPTVSFNWLDLPEGRILAKLMSTRFTYTMTPRMYLSALLQYSSTTTSLTSSVRFRWEYIPGSELFVVYQEGRDTFPVRRTDLENRGFIVKVNRLFRF
jgi:hypothetical protein